MGSPAHGRFVCSGADVQVFSDRSKLFQVRQLTVSKIYDAGARDVDVTVL